jgi:hypothetical protein
MYKRGNNDRREAEPQKYTTQNREDELYHMLCIDPIKELPQGTCSIERVDVRFGASGHCLL